MKPMIKYRGGKSREIPQIKKYIPEYNGKYIEPFFGGGAVFFHLEPEQAIVNDINTPLMTFYCCVRDNYQQLRKELDTVESEYNLNRRSFEKLKGINPNNRVADKNSILSNSRYVQRPCGKAVFGCIFILFHKQNRLLRNDSVQFTR